VSPNDMAYHGLTRRKMLDYIRDIKRTVVKAQDLIFVGNCGVPQTLADLSKAKGLLDGAIIHCERARRDLDAVKPKKKEKR